MKCTAKVMETPIGQIAAPASPQGPKILAPIKTKEDLFALVRNDGFVNPDALTEVCARRWYGEYLAWIRTQKRALDR